MRRTLLVCGAVAAAWLGGPAAALAQNRVEQQVFLDLRTLQEQNQQLRLLINTLGEQIKAVTTKLDAEANARNRGFADQQTLIKNANTSLSALQENVRDNKVQVQKLNQELDAIKKGVDILTTLVTQTLAQMPTAPPPADPNAPPGPAPPAPAAGGVPASGKDYYDRAFGDYAVGQYDMAIQGFEEMLRRFPNSPDGGQAQFLIGDAYFNLGKFKEAVAAYDRVIKNYKDSEHISDAYYKQGVCYEQLKQPDLAIINYELLRKDYPGTSGELQATQVLKRLGRIK